jgi:hypothetical protein
MFPKRCVSKPGLTTSTALCVSSNLFKSTERAVASCFKPHLIAGINEISLFLYIMISHKSDMLGWFPVPLFDIAGANGGNYPVPPPEP